MEQVTAGKGGDFNIVKGQLQNFKTLKIICFQLIIRDEYAVFSADDPSLARKLVEKENKHGNNNIKFSSQINSAIEYFKGKKKDEITIELVKKLKASGANITKK
jgi:hypothetical protein